MAAIDTKPRDLTPGTTRPARRRDSLMDARAVARECFRGWRSRAHFDAKTMARLAQLKAANPWLEE